MYDLFTATHSTRYILYFGWAKHHRLTRNNCVWHAVAQSYVTWTNASEHLQFFVDDLEGRRKANVQFNMSEPLPSYSESYSVVLLDRYLQPTVASTLCMPCCAAPIIHFPHKNANLSLSEYIHAHDCSSDNECFHTLHRPRGTICHRRLDNYLTLLLSNGLCAF